MAGSVAAVTGRNAAVAGGGPVGAITALMLAKQGWQVQVFEQADRPSTQPPHSDHRAYRLTMMSRGLRVLKLADVDLQPLIATNGSLLEGTFFRANGQVNMSQRIPVTEDPTCVRGFRDEVAAHIIKEAQRQYPEAIKFHFNTAVEKIDLERQTIYALSAESGPEQVSYDLLVGADGAGSVVRSALQQIMPASYVRRYKHKQMYSMGRATPSNPEDVPKHAVTQLHPTAAKEGTIIWDGRGSDDCRVAITLPQELADALRQGKTEDFDRIMDGSCPALPGYAREAVMELAHSRPPFYPMPSWTHLSQLHGPKVVLLGDAAHTMSPVMGQGLNSGLEDVAVFAEVLEQHQGNVDTALPAYNTARLLDIQAIMTMNEVVSSRDVGLASTDQDAAHKAWLFGHKMLLILHFIVQTGLQRVAPSKFKGPCIKQLMTGVVPYRTFTSTLYRDGLCFAGAVATVSALAVHMCS